MRRLVPALFLLAACAGAPDAPQRVPVPPRSSVRVAAESLKEHHLISSTAWFRLRARLAGVDRIVKAGIYEFPAGTSTASILHAFKSGSSLRFRVTLPPGGTIYDLAHAASATLPLTPDALLAAASDTAVLRQFDLPGPSVEGWLLPESFDFGGFDTPREVIDRFLAARRDAWDSTWDGRARKAGFDRKGLLTMASIVEGEALVPSDRPLVAAVYRNRLRLHMPLQADPTIQYAYLLRDGARKGELFNKDYLLDSPWNTYRHPGLPPGPIGNPSHDAIEAVLEPSKEPYLYFVAGPDGKHLFAKTYAEHLKNIRKVRGK